MNKLSNLDKTCRVLAYCFRFFKYKGNRPSSLIVTTQAMSNSLNVLCRCVQKQAFPWEYDRLSKDNSVFPPSSLISLCPFLGKDDPDSGRRQTKKFIFILWRFSSSTIALKSYTDETCHRVGAHTKSTCGLTSHHGRS